MKFFLLLFSVQLFALSYYPTDGWISKNVEDSGFNPIKFQNLIDFVFTTDDENPHVTNGFIVIKDGYVVFEDYANGFTADNKHIMWSISKSLSNTVFGIAEYQGIINKSHRFSDYVSIPRNINNRDYWQSITLNSFLQMSSGVAWREAYEDDPTNSDVTNTLFMDGQKDIVSYSMNLPFEHKPSEKFKYSTAEASIFLGALRGALNDDQRYAKFPFKELFEPLGITDATIERDKNGNFYGGSYYYLRPIDLAKVGLLWLNNGVWEGKRLFAEDWREYSTTVSQSWLNTELEGFANREGHGAQWWLNRDHPEKGLERPYPSAPESMFMGIGHHGQRLIILPSHNIVVVRTGIDRRGRIDTNRLLELLMESLR